MSKRSIPTHPEGWKFAGAAGQYKVWHAGKNLYRITSPADGAVIGEHSQFGLAHAQARQLDAVNSYYVDRNTSGQAALTAYR